MLKTSNTQQRGGRTSIYLLPAMGIILLLAGIGWALRGRTGATHAHGIWQLDGLAGNTVHFLAVGHRSRPLVFAGTESGVFRRENTGSWTRVLARPGIWSVELLDDDRTVVAGDGLGFVDLSRDAGVHWGATSVSHDAVYAVSFVPGSRRVILAGAGGGLYRSIDGGAHWQKQLTLLGSAIATIAWSPESRAVVYAGAVSSTVSGSIDVYMSRDAGISWHRYGRAWNSGGGIMSVLPTGRNTLFAGTMGRAVWTVRGASGSWRRSAVGMPPANDHVSGLARVPGHPDHLLAATLGTGVYRSDDNGRHWVTSSDGLSDSKDAMIVLSLAYSPRASSLYAGTAVGVYRRSPAVQAP